MLGPNHLSESDRVSFPVKVRTPAFLHLFFSVEISSLLPIPNQNLVGAFGLTIQAQIYIYIYMYIFSWENCFPQWSHLQLGFLDCLNNESDENGVFDVGKSRASKEPQSPKIARTAPKKGLKISRVLPNKTRVSRQFARESSPESSENLCRTSSLGFLFFVPARRHGLRQVGLCSLIFWVFGELLNSEEVLVSHQRVSGFPDKGPTSGQVRDFQGSRGTLAEVWETSGEPLWIAVQFCSERTSGKSPENFGELLGKSRNFPEAWGSLTPRCLLSSLPWYLKGKQFWCYAGSELPQGPFWKTVHFHSTRPSKT